MSSAEAALPAPHLPLRRDLPGSAASAEDMHHRAGEQSPGNTPAGAAARATACSPASGHLRRQGRKPSLSPVAHLKLPPCDADNYDTWVCCDDLNFIRDVIDHEKGMARDTKRRNLDCVGTGAVRIHLIGALLGRRDYGAVQAVD